MVPSQTKRQAPPTSSCSLIAMAGMCSGLDWSQTLYFIVSPSLHDQPTGYEILLPLFRIDTEVNSLPMVTHLLSGKTGSWTQAFFPWRPVRHHATLTLGPNGGSACGLCWNVLSLFRENKKAWCGFKQVVAWSDCISPQFTQIMDGWQRHPHPHETINQFMKPENKGNHWNLLNDISVEL